MTSRFSDGAEKPEGVFGRALVKTEGSTAKFDEGSTSIFDDPEMTFWLEQSGTKAQWAAVAEALKDSTDPFVESLYQHAREISINGHGSFR